MPALEQPPELCGGCASLWRVARLRVRLLIKQKLGWGSLLAGVACVLLAMLFAQASFLSPARIFWDFALGSSFALQSVFVIYLGSQLFSEERNRRTLHLLIASAVPRWAWLCGNALGLWLGALLLNVAWLAVAAAAYFGAYGLPPSLMIAQAQWMLAVEMLVVVFGATLFSLWVRPLLAFGSAAAMFLFLHSVSAIEAIFADKESGKLISATAFRGVLRVAKVLPPLEWFDLRVLVGYQDRCSWGAFGALTALGLLWALLLAGLATWRFERMDL